MSAAPANPQSSVPTPPTLTDYAVWLVVGMAGAALFFAASIHVPQEIKLVGPFGIGLGLLAGWGLGLWAVNRQLNRPALVVTLVWVIIAAGEVLAAVQTHRLGIKPKRLTSKPGQMERDMITEGMREYYAREPDDLPEEELARWREGRDLFERGERMHQEEREKRELRRSFYGYLANRIPEKRWGRWSYPWPAVYWVAEILIGSTLGAWLARRTLQAAAPRADGDRVPAHPGHEIQGSHR